MINPDHFAVTLARAAHIFRTSQNIVEQKTALRTLVGLSRLGSATVALRSGVLTVEGKQISSALPLIDEFADTLARRGVGTIWIAQGAPPAELLGLLRRLADVADPESPGGATSQAGVGGSGVFVSPIGAEAEVAGSQIVPDLDLVALGSSTSPLADALRRLEASPYGADVLERASDVGTAAAAAFDEDHVEEAVEALALLIALEDRAPAEDARRCYGIALRRSLTRGALQRVSRLLPDSRYGAAAAVVMRRAGSDGTKVLVDQIASLPTVEERRLVFDSLRRVPEGYHLIVSMLRHPDWFVVRNAAWLVGDLGIYEAVGELTAAVEHWDGRVRQAAAAALAKLGTPETAEPLLRILRSDDDQLRSIVLSAVKGRAADALVRPIVIAAQGEKDPEQFGEYLKALGRIGTPDAVRFLIKTAQPGRRIIGRKSKEERLAAIEGLGIAGGAPAQGTLESLMADRDRDISDAARHALRTGRRG